MSAHLTIFFILCQTFLTRSFTIVSYTQHEQSYQPGQTLSLTCRADSAWEFCLWKHTNMEKEVVRDCLMEWKRAKGGVSVQTCADSLTDRISISGDYDSHECGLTITSLQLEDAGNWECEMEEYKFGDWVSGYKHSQNITVSVQQKRSTTTTTTTTHQTSPLSQQTTTTTTTKIHTASDEYEMTIDDLEGKLGDDSNSIASDGGDISEEIVYNDDIEALPIEDREAAEGSSSGLIAVVLVSVSALVIAVAVGAVWWNRKRKSMAIVSLHMNKDDSLAANAFLEEAEYHISIIKDPQN